jgi:Ion channel
MKERFKRWQERTREPSLTALLVAEVLLIFVVLPLDARHLVSGAVLTVMIALFLIANLLVVLQSRMAMFVFAASVILSEIATFLHDKHASALTDWLDAGGRHTAICAVSWVIVKTLFEPGPVTLRRIEAAIVVYLNIGLFFFTAYRFALRLAPDAFSGAIAGPDQSRSAIDLMYFSLAALMSIGYDKIAPAHPLVRVLAGVESLIGLLYPAALVAGLIIMRRRQRRPER